MDTPIQLSELNDAAGYMVADSDLWVVRRFEKLHLVNILAIQKRLSKLQHDFEATVNYERDPTKGQTFPKPKDSSEQILLNLQSAIKAYDEAILSFAAIRKTEDPAGQIMKGMNQIADAYSNRSLQSLRPTVCDRGATSHLLSIATGSRTWLHRCIGRHHRLSSIFRNKVKDKPSNVEYFTSYSEANVRRAEFGIIAACLCLIQLLPVLALRLVSKPGVKIAIIIVLIIIVSLLNALFANTVRATNFGAIAAYSAIVVVFISQNN